MQLLTPQMIGGGVGMDASYQNDVQPLTRRLDLGNIERDVYYRMGQWEFEMLPYFTRRGEIHIENCDYAQSYQWSKADIMEHLSKMRKPYVFNLMRSAIETFLGEQRGQRTDIKAIPTNTFSENYTEITDHYLRWVCQVNDWHDKNSDITRDGAVGGVAFASVFADPHAPRSNVQIEAPYPLQFMWDIPSALDARLNGIRKFWRGYHTNVADAVAKYPEFVDQIERSAGAPDRYTLGLQTLVRPKVHAPANRLMETYQWSGQSVFSYDNVFMREYYEKEYEDKFIVFDGVTGDKAPFDSYEEAVEWGKWLWNYYSQPAIAEMYGFSRPVVSEPELEKVPYWHQYVFAGSTLVYHQKTESGSLPYKPFIPEWWHGDCTSYFEHGKAPQRFFNRLMSAIDERESGAKGGLLINKAYLDGSYKNDAEIKWNLVQTNPMLIVNKEDSDFSMDQVIKQIPPPVHTPGLDNMLPIMQGTLYNLFGGPNAVGQQAFAGQSGRSAEALQAAASTRLIPIFDKNRMFQREVGKELIYRMQFLNPTIRMTVTNEYNENLSTSLAERGVRNPQDLSYVVYVSEVSATPTEQQATLDRVAFVIQAMGDEEAKEDFMPLLIKNMPLNPSERRMFLENRQARIQARNQMQQEQIQFERQKEMAKIQNDNRRLDIQERELAWKEQNQPKWNVQVKPNETGPFLMGTVLNASGESYEADPMGVLQDKAMQAAFEQDVSNMQQENFNKRVPVWQRQSGSRAPKGTMTPKDRKQRKNR